MLSCTERFDDQVKDPRLVHHSNTICDSIKMFSDVWDPYEFRRMVSDILENGHNDVNCFFLSEMDKMYGFNLNLYFSC